MMESFNKKDLDYIGKTFKKKKETIAAAESVTSGVLQFALSSITDASQFFQGGLTAYNLGQKCKHLLVEPIHAQMVNCVSQRVATEMAIGISQLFSSDWGIGITGYASPVPESGNKVFAYYSIVYKKKVKGYGKIIPGKATPAQIQVHYVNAIISKLVAKLR
jgi:nicotinamide-nucleotide amidase